MPANRAERFGGVDPFLAGLLEPAREGFPVAVGLAALVAGGVRLGRGAVLRRLVLPQTAGDLGELAFQLRHRGADGLSQRAVLLVGSLRFVRRHVGTCGRLGVLLVHLGEVDDRVALLPGGVTDVAHPVPQVGERVPVVPQRLLYFGQGVRFGRELRIAGTIVELGPSGVVTCGRLGDGLGRALLLGCKAFLLAAQHACL